MVEHAFYKKQTTTMDESVKKAFSNLPEVSKLKMDKFEIPFNSIRRVLGDSFYNLKDSKYEMLKLVINDKVSFDIDALSQSSDLMTDITQIVAYLFQQFAIMNKGSTTFTPEFMKEKCVDLAVTTSHGVKKVKLAFEDFAKVASFNDSNQIIGIRYISEITACTEALKKNDEAYKKMYQMQNTHAIQQLNEEHDTLINKLKDYNTSIIKNLFEIIEEQSGIDNIKDVYDVEFIFYTEISDESDPNSKINTMTVFDLHDVASINVVVLENKFYINRDIAKN